MPETKKKFTETLINILFNNGIIRFVLIFGITGLIIYSLIALNPFNVINKYSLFCYIFFLILILLASTIVLFFNFYKNYPKYFGTESENGNINFFSPKVGEELMNKLMYAVKIIGIILLFFAIISGIFLLALNTPNIIVLMNILLITITTIVVLTITYIFFENKFNEVQNDANPKNTLGNFIMDIIFFIPCLLLDSIKYLEKEFKTTINLTWILLGIEIIFILLYFLIPYIVKILALQGGRQLLVGPVYTNNITNLGNYQNLIVKNENKLSYNYNYTISFSLWINPQPINTNINYNKYTSLFNYANKPNILYNGKTNTIKIICETKKNHLVNIYKTNKFPYQSWMNFVIILRTGIMDIFLNNNLVASVPEVTPYMKNDKVTVGEKDGINGGIKNILYFNKPLNNNEIMWIK